MKKKLLILIFLWMLVILWMGFIFSFSSETASESSQTSGSFLEVIITFFNPDFETYSPEVKMAIIEQNSYFIRKTAHFCIYAFLGFLISNAFAYQRKAFFKPSVGKSAFFSVMLGGLYAVSDELHQSLVPGRSCELGDMALDTCGVITGVICSIVVVYLIQKRRTFTAKQNQV
ncbi:MAG: hypothetical protein E7638_09060 [Ruminococcaceae bacterium]|nr:hypothetical protein [Oscillospiraceae bacterium]